MQSELRLRVNPLDWLGSSQFGQSQLLPHDLAAATPALGRFQGRSQRVPAQSILVRILRGAPGKATNSAERNDQLDDFWSKPCAKTPSWSFAKAELVVSSTNKYALAITPADHSVQQIKLAWSAKARMVGSASKTVSRSSPTAAATPRQARASSLGLLHDPRNRRSGRERSVASGGNLVGNGRSSSSAIVG
jgi:hypothetical protein